MQTTRAVATKYALPLLAVYLPVTIVLLLLGSGLNRVPWIACFAGGLLLWTSIEYVMHRFVFHEPSAVRGLGSGGAAHSRHHQTPSEAEFILTPLSFSSPVAALVFGVLRLVMGSWERAAIMMAGVIAGYLWYEVLHLQIHTNPKAGAFLRRLRRYHYRHHFNHTDLGFGVTTPLWDVLLRTFPRA